MTSVEQALSLRKSVRAFTDKPVTKEQINKLLNLASQAPSGSNSQPWQVAVLLGDAKRRLQERIIGAAKAGETPQMEYGYYPAQWREPYLSRRRACGLSLYSALGIQRDDNDARQQQWLANYRAFDAPAMLLFFIDKDLLEGSYMDYGMFLQSFMLAAVGEGLASCPQASLADYPKIVKQTLGYDDSTILLCGMALGYEDTSAAVNHYQTEREKSGTFTQFFE